MLNLRFEEVLPRAASRIVLRDSTGSYDATANPGGYGGPNPLRTTLALFGLLARLTPGSYDFNLTIGTQELLPNSAATTATLSFVITDDQDGVYQAVVLAVPYSLAPATAPAGTLRYDGTRLLKTISGSSEETLNPALLTLTELRENQPRALTVAEAVLPLLLAGGLQRGIDASLHAFVGTNSRSVLEREARELWLTGETALAAIKVLFRTGRLPEASQYLSVTQRVLTGGLPVGPLAPTAINSWNHA